MKSLILFILIAMPLTACSEDKQSEEKASPPKTLPYLA